MNEENQVSPDAETQNPAPDETTQTPAVVEPNAEGQEPQTEQPPPLTDAEKEAKALKRRVDRLTQQKYQLAAELEAAQRRPAEQPSQTQEPGQFSQQQFDALVQQRAQEIAQGQTINQKLDSVEDKVRKAVGKPAYDDFYEDLKSAGTAAAVLLENALELDDSERVMTHFVNDREEFDKVLQLPPKKQAIYLGQLSARLAVAPATPRTGTAPKPLTPINSRGTARATEAALTDEDLVRSIRATR